MRKFYMVLTGMIFLLSSCKKAEQYFDRDEEGILTGTAVVVKQGKLLSTLVPKLNNGVVKLYLRQDGKYVVALEQINLYNTNDLAAYFSTGPSLPNLALKLFSFKNIPGNLYYEIPAGIDISAAKFLLLQDDVHTLPVGTAALQ